jgi:hypothetical protein
VNTEVIWRPQVGPQHALIKCPFPEILFGGARGGGKTDGVLGKFAIKEARYGRGFNAVFFRREMPQADDLIERAKEIYVPTGARWRDQSKQFVMPHGGRIRFRPLENTAAAAKYQGQNITDIAVEEAGNFPSSAPIDMLFGTLRSKAGVPAQMVLTANPGGPGQQWIKARFVDPAPLGLEPLPRTKIDGTPLQHRAIFIPSKLRDNRLLTQADPGYEDRLHLSGPPELVRAWIDGDWDAIFGAFFPEFSTKRHVIAPRELPSHWPRFRSFDWGSARPFSVGWWAVSDGSVPDIARGCIVRYREWYGMQPGQPNVGLRMTAEAIAAGIRQREADDPGGPMLGVADPAIFTEDGGPSIAMRMSAAPYNVIWRAADNKRVPGRGAMGGWDLVRQRLIGDVDDKPMILLFSTCRDLIRTLPALQHDAARAEDVDTDNEDHAADECRYACASRPWIRDAVKPKVRDSWADAFDRDSEEASGWRIS